MQVIYRDLTLTGAFSITGAGNTIQNPWGSFPGSSPMIDQDFDRARESAVLVGAAYDFKALVRGLSANANFVGEWAPSIPPHAEGSQSSGVRLHRRLPASVRRAVLQGMWFRARAAILDQQDAKTLGPQFRLTITGKRT